MKLAQMMFAPSPHVKNGLEWLPSPCASSIQENTVKSLLDNVKSIECEALVVGCGVAGNATAIRLAEQGINVTMISAAEEAHQSATYWAQGGIIYKGKDDSPSLLAADIHRAGAGMCDAAAVDKISNEGPKWVEKMLIDCTDVPFERQVNGELALTLEASHNRARILYKADHTGKVIASSMVKAVENHPQIKLVLGQVAMELLMDEHGICRGVIALSKANNKVCIYSSEFTMLATGGSGDLYVNTSNPTGACGEGIGLAARAGAKLKNMQYVQFHPTTLYIPGENRFLLTEALRGEGAILRDAKGRAFAKDYHPDGELSPRDVVARMILSEMAKQQAPCMYLDITHMDNEWLQRRFPTIYAYCMSKGIDMTTDFMPVVPAAHYHCGGIEVDLNGQTSIPGLYAAGEVSCTGVHGANRLASTSLLEGLVWGCCAADHFIAAREKPIFTRRGVFVVPASFRIKGRVRDATDKELTEIRVALQQLMWESFGPLRSKSGMQNGLQKLAKLDQRVQALFTECFITHQTASLRNALKAASEIAIAATTARISIAYSDNQYMWSTYIFDTFSPQNTMTTDSAPRVFGIDLGSQRCVVASHTGDLVLNELGGMTTATLVSFKGEERMIGESAVLSSSTNPQNTINSLHLLVGQSYESIFARYERIPGQRARIKQCLSTLLSSDAAIVVEYHGNNEKQFCSEQLLAMLLRKLAYPMKLEPQDQVFIAIPSAWTAREQRALHIAARIGGLSNLSLVTREAALAACYHSKHPLQEEDTIKHMVIVDMGHTSTSVALVQLKAQGSTIVSTACEVSLGAENLDLALYEYFKQQVADVHGWQVSHHGKEGKRLLDACEKLKRLLSTIDKASVTVENIVPDHDYTLTLSREMMESLWKSELSRLDGLLRQLNVEGVVIESVEIVGGGTRIPSVQQVISLVFSTSSLGRRLDSTTSIAVGAALAQSLPVSWEWTQEENDAITSFVVEEEEMEARDANLTAIAHERNAIESFIYDMRSKQQDAMHGSKLNPTVLDPLLNTAEEWLYSEASELATLSEMKRKRQEIQQEIQVACASYFTAIANENQAMEAELEAQAQQAEQERLLNGEDQDYDTRKLKKPERIRLVHKNKEEGTELFQGGNYQHAAMRYVKALSHVSKVLDPNPTEQNELTSLKLSLYLNLAQCYIKLQQWTKVIGNCQEALTVDPSSVKALYRRAVAHEQLQQMDEATKDIQAALVIAPEDKAVIKMDARLKHWHKKQLEKEKKMWGKAFA